MKIYSLEEAVECSELLVLPLFEDSEISEEIKSLTGEISLDGLCLEKGQEYYILNTKQPVLIVGLGKKEKISQRKLREFAGKIARTVKKAACIYTQSIVCEYLDLNDIVKELVTGVITGQYDYVKIGAKAEDKPEISIIAPKEQMKLADAAALMSSCVNYARTLGNTPSNYMTPEVLADEAKKLSDQLGTECEILTNRELEDIGAGAILGVNKGSSHEARLIVLTYRGDDDAPFTALIGKGLTFDAGGYNLKSAVGMKGMKFDMCGAANVLGAFEYIVRNRAKANVMAVIAATENKIGPDGYNCDDVLVSLSKKTIEVTNTDAEGRLILCDAITYAQQKGAVRLIDMATLTGACVSALGNNYTGVFTNSEQFLDEFKCAALRADEGIWQLPVDEYFHKLLKDSSVADMTNAVRGAYGGSSIAAAFLEEFVEEGVEWIHLDIAGTSDIPKKKPYMAVGATGVMIRTLAEMFC